MFAAPLSFVAARMVQKGIAGALSVAPPDSMGSAMFLMVLLLKAAEYGTLGLAVAWLGGAAWARMRHFTLAGLGAGLVSGLALVVTLYLQCDPRMPRPKVAAQSINEILFPMGCSLVLYASTVLGRQLRRS